MIDINPFTYEQFYYDIFEELECVFVDSIDNDISKIINFHFTKNVVEMIEFLQEALKPKFDEVEVLQIKTLEKNLFLVKKNRKASLA